MKENLPQVSVLDMIRNGTCAVKVTLLQTLSSDPRLKRCRDRLLLLYLQKKTINPPNTPLLNIIESISVKFRNHGQESRNQGKLKDSIYQSSVFFYENAWQVAIAEILFFNLCFRCLFFIPLNASLFFHAL